MVQRPESRIRTVLATVGDLVPRAFWSLEVDGTELEGTATSAHMRGVRWICPAPGALDHWETVQAGEPWAYLEAAPDGLWAGLQVEGAQAVERVAHVIDDSDRVERLVAAAARFGPWSTTAAVAVREPPEGRFQERVLRARSVETDQVGREVLVGIMDAARDGAGLARNEVVGVRFVRLPVDEADTVALRKAVRRIARMWQAVWRVPQPKRAAPAKEELERSLRALYQGSLRNVLHGDPKVRARLRVDARALARQYRDSGRVRPRLLDDIMVRLDVVE